MNILKWILRIVALIVPLLMCIITPVSWIGVLLVLFGLYQLAQRGKGKLTLAKPGWFVSAGIIFSIIMAMVLVETPDEPKDQVASVQVKEDKKKADLEAKKEEQAKKEAQEKKAKEEEEKKAKEEAEKKKAAEEQKARKEAEEMKEQEEKVASLGLEAVTVARAVDGDTLELSDGRKIRLIGVNTPESTNKTEDYGKEASNYTSSKLEGKKVWIQKDVSDTDRYDRYLRVVWLSIPSDDMNESEIRSKMFNADLVLNGYAEPSTYTPDVKYSDYFVKFAREARDKDTGLWAYGENGTTKGGLDPEPAPAKETTASSSSSSSSTEAAPAASSTPAPEYFKNCTELRKVYPSGVPSTHPAYASKHDRDKDNYACER
jgi:micrococcal nuclease